MEYKSMSDKDREDLITEIKNSPTSRLKLLLSHLKLFKDTSIILTNKELEIQKEYRKMIISELISRGKRGDL